MSAVLTALIVVVAVEGTLVALTWLIARTGGRRAPQLGAEVLVDDVSLHYIAQGEGPAVVFIHGAKGSTFDMAMALGPALASRYRAIAVDRPGCGYSGRPRRDGGSPVTQAHLIRAFLAQLGIERPVVVGHSLGGAVALALALEDPDAVAAVVALDAYAFAVGGSHKPLAVLYGVPVLGPLLRWTIVVPVGLLVAPAVLRAIFRPEAVPPGYARVAPRLALDPRRLKYDGEDLRAVDADLRALARRYGSLGVPLVIAHGTEDRVIRPAMAERLDEAVPESYLVMLPGAGHMPHVTQPEAVVEAVDEAARRAAAAAALRRPQPAVTATS